MAIPQDPFSIAVQYAIYELDTQIKDTVSEGEEMKNNSDFSKIQSFHQEDADFSDEKQPDPQTDSTINAVKLGELVHVLWSHDNQRYPGTIKHLHRDGCATVQYEDGDVERLKLNNESWYYENIRINAYMSSATDRL